MQGDYKLKLTTAAQEDARNQSARLIYSVTPDHLNLNISHNGPWTDAPQCRCSFAGAVE